MVSPALPSVSRLRLREADEGDVQVSEGPVRTIETSGSLSEGIRIQLPDRGNLADDEVRLSANGTGGTTLRSCWIGPATVTARSVAFTDARASVDFAFPWIFLAAALLGGALGGLATRLQKRDAPWLRRVGVGALLGLIAAVLYAVGVNVTPVRPAVTTGQAVVFGLAALVGYLGTLGVPVARGGA